MILFGERNHLSIYIIHYICNKCNPMSLVRLQDFLKIDLKNLIEENDNFNEVSIVSNLPYYITSDILEKIIISRNNLHFFYFK